MASYHEEAAQTSAVFTDESDCERDANGAAQADGSRHPVRRGVPTCPSHVGVLLLVFVVDSFSLRGVVPELIFTSNKSI